MLERVNNKPIPLHCEFRHSITRRTPPRGFIDPASIPMLPSRVAGSSAGTNPPFPPLLVLSALSSSRRKPMEEVRGIESPRLISRSINREIDGAEGTSDDE